jgi:hypothetical protein
MAPTQRLDITYQTLYSDVRVLLERQIRGR